MIPDAMKAIASLFRGVEGVTSMEFKEKSGEISLGFELEFNNRFYGYSMRSATIHGLLCHAQSALDEHSKRAEVA